MFHRHHHLSTSFEIELIAFKIVIEYLKIA